MENNDEVADSTLNRIDNLERIIRKFRLVVSGDGIVKGGFGKLPKPAEEYTPQERLNNIKQAVDAFGFGGDNVNVSGSFDDGVKFS